MYEAEIRIQTASSKASRRRHQRQRNAVDDVAETDAKKLNEIVINSGHVRRSMVQHETSIYGWRKRGKDTSKIGYYQKRRIKRHSGEVILAARTPSSLRTYSGPTKGRRCWIADAPRIDENMAILEKSPTAHIRSEETECRLEDIAPARRASTTGAMVEVEDKCVTDVTPGHCPDIAELASLSAKSSGYEAEMRWADSESAERIEFERVGKRNTTAAGRSIDI
ncbi:hypothetical protein R3P38DRAFT_2800519 [Favolaschia claudopus]|uniref:Uncharacterized protein n=1 Tax=Favolaschia claudopus TaxID=2862362 RepID=A0AAV9ZXW4_9AGAR